ncbi:unnamed protein product [Closterium sp. NIES-65]|nr:unnamed protein product [Closterium sp. NIES-65]
MMDVSTIEDALARLVKRHGAVRAKELALLDKVQQALEQMQAALQAEMQAEATERAGGLAERREKGEIVSDASADVATDVTKPSLSSATLNSNPGCRAAVSSLLSRLGSLGPEKEIAALHRELHGAVARLSKAVEREKEKGTFVADIGGAYREAVQFDPVIVNREIAKHLFRQGLFAVGDALVAEAGLGDAGRGAEGEGGDEAEEGEVREGEEDGEEGEAMEEGKGDERMEVGEGAGAEADIERGSSGRAGSGRVGGVAGEGGGGLWGEGVAGRGGRARLSWSARRRMASGSGAGGGGAGGGSAGARAGGEARGKDGGVVGAQGGAAAVAGGEARGGVGGVGEGVSLQEHRHRYGAMHAILHAIRAKDLGPALAWAAQHREELQREVAGGFPDVKVGGGEGGGKAVVGGLKTSSLEFEIHRLQFLNLLQEQQKQLIWKQQQQQKECSFFMSDPTSDENHGQSRPATSPALQYARQHFPPFAATHLPDIQRLMCALLWVGRLNLSPYADLLPLTAAHWDQIAARFTADYCAVECLESAESPLAVVVAAGGEALPMLTKLAALLNHSSGIGSGGGISRSGGSTTIAATTPTAVASTPTTAAAGGTGGSRRAARDWQGMEQLPVEIELPRAFHFHSIFACPVSREPASYPDNPPVLLPCGHVVCRASVLKLAKGATRPFKCPYCPLETTPLDCRPIQRAGLGREEGWKGGDAACVAVVAREKCALLSA